jgi:putative transposase
MPSSHVSHHMHVVFATKHRIKAIREDLQPKLWAYLAGIAKNHGMHAVAIGGIEDHVHALIDLGPLLGVAKAVQTLKANSSRWISEQLRTGFEWQAGYFACSVSRSQVPSVMRYIAKQKQHHKKMDFGVELAFLLEKHGFPAPQPRERPEQTVARHGSAGNVDA